MDRLLRIKMHDKKVNFAPYQNLLNKSSIRTAFLLTDRAIVSMSYTMNGDKVHCETNEDGSAFILPQDFPNMDFSVKSDETFPRPSTSADVEESTSRKRQRVDQDLELLSLNGDVISRISKYAWFYTRGDDMKRSATPVAKNLAITFRHGVNQNLVKGDSIKLSSYHNQQMVVDTCVVLVDDVYDLIVLQSKSAKLCDRDLIFEAVGPQIGMGYVWMGYSATDRQTPHISFSTGTISTNFGSRLCFLGSSGYFKGDSGGSCWNNYGRLVGMQIVADKGPHATDNHGGRCVIISSKLIEFKIMEFLPPDKDAHLYTPT